VVDENAKFAEASHKEWQPFCVAVFKQKEAMDLPRRLKKNEK